MIARRGAPTRAGRIRTAIAASIMVASLCISFCLYANIVTQDHRFVKGYGAFLFPFVSLFSFFAAGLIMGCRPRPRQATRSAGQSSGTRTEESRDKREGRRVWCREVRNARQWCERGRGSVGGARARRSRRPARCLHSRPCEASRRTPGVRSRQRREDTKGHNGAQRGTKDSSCQLRVFVASWLPCPSEQGGPRSKQHGHAPSAAICAQAGPAHRPAEG